MSNNNRKGIKIVSDILLPGGVANIQPASDILQNSAVIEEIPDSVKFVSNEVDNLQNSVVIEEISDSVEVVSNEVEIFEEIEYADECVVNDNAIVNNVAHSEDVEAVEDIEKTTLEKIKLDHNYAYMGPKKRRQRIVRFHNQRRYHSKGGKYLTSRHQFKV